MENNKPKLFTLSAPSGCGKDAIIEEVCKRLPHVGLSVSCTTREPRFDKKKNRWEEEGVDYFFIDDEAFAEKVRQGGFLEYARFADRWYGTPRAYVEELYAQGNDAVILNIENQGAMQIKAMTDRGYPKNFSTSVVTTASVMGPIIPPSILMVLYGITAGVSIQRQFIGGILPGIFYAICCCAMCWYYGKKYSFPKGDKFSMKRVWSEFKDSVWALLAPVIILGGILTGVFTATESGAVACVYVVLVGIFVYKELSLKQVLDCFLESAKTTGSILLIAATANVLGFCMTYDMIPQKVAAALTGSISNVTVMMLIFTLIYLFLGCIMEGSAIILTTVPIFVGICRTMGIDLVYFGVFVSVLLSVATVTPPVGTVMFVICKKNDLTIGQYFKNMLPWFGMIIFVCVVIACFPILTTLLPTLLYG